MGQDEQIDYLLFQNDLRYRLRSLEHDQVKNREIDEFVPFASTIIDLQEQRRRIETVDAEQLARVISDLEEAVKDTQKSIEEKLKAAEKAGQPFSPAIGNRAARMVDRLQRAFSGWYRFYAGYDPLFTWWVEKPYSDADSALKAYSSFLRKKVVGITDKDNPPIIGGL